MAEDFNVDVNFHMIDYGKVTRDAVNEMAKKMEAEERADITAAGMGKYAKRTRVRVQDRGDKGYVVRLMSGPNWMRAFEFGAESVGRPMLWIPAPGNIFGKTRASKYPGKLIRPKGKNILFNPVTRKVAYIGIPRTTISPVLNMRDIANNEAVKFVGYIKGAADA